MTQTGTSTSPRTEIVDRLDRVEILVLVLLSQDFRARLWGDSGYNEELIVSIMLSKTFSKKLRPSVVKISTLSSTIRVSPKDYIAPVSICWTDSNTFGKHESFTLSEDA